MMKLLFENWKHFLLSEGEKQYFPWLEDLENLKKPTTDDEIYKLEEKGWEYKAAGSFRAVFIPPNEKDYILKVVRSDESLDEVRAQNKAEFEVSNKYPTIFPKVYVHDKDFDWIVIDRVFVDPDMNINEIVKNTFPELYEIIKNYYIDIGEEDFINPILALSKWPWSGHSLLLDLIVMAASKGSKNSTRPSPRSLFDVENLSADQFDTLINLIFKEGMNTQNFSELHKAVVEYNIHTWDIRKGNVGYRIENNKQKLVIIDPGIWESEDS